MGEFKYKIIALTYLSTVPIILLGFVEVLLYTLDGNGPTWYVGSKWLLTAMEFYVLYLFYKGMYEQGKHIFQLTLIACSILTNVVLGHHFVSYFAGILLVPLLFGQGKIAVMYHIVYSIAFLCSVAYNRIFGSVINLPLGEVHSLVFIYSFFISFVLIFLLSCFFRDILERLEKELVISNIELGIEVQTKESRLIKNDSIISYQKILLCRIKDSLNEFPQELKADKDISLLAKEIDLGIRQFESKNNVYTHKIIEPVFHRKLTETFPSLTQNEIKLCGFLKENLSTKEIAELCFRTEKTINASILKIRQKTNVPSAQKLRKTLMDL